MKKSIKYYNNKIIISDFWLWLYLTINDNKPIAFEFDEDRNLIFAEFSRNSNVVDAINRYGLETVRSDLKRKMKHKKNGMSNEKIEIIEKVLNITGYQL